MQKRMMITGAGSGLGREIALRWAREGWQLALSDVNDAGLAETLKGPIDRAIAKGIKVVAFDVDLNNPKVTQIEQDHHALARLALDKAIADNGSTFNAARYASVSTAAQAWPTCTFKGASPPGGSSRGCTFSTRATM